MAYRVVTETGNEPISLSELKLHLRIDSSEEDALLDVILKAARQKAESYTGRKFVTSTFQMTLSEFPEEVELHPSPVISIDSVSYKNGNNISQTLSSGVYSLDNTIDPSQFYLEYNQSFPSTLSVRDAVTINYTCGYADDDSIPAPVKAAILLIAGHLYENRQIVSTMQTYEVPMTASYLLDPYRIMKA